MFGCGEGFPNAAGLGIKGLVAGCEVIIGNRKWMQAQGMKIPKTLESQANIDEAKG